MQRIQRFACPGLAAVPNSPLKELWDLLFSDYVQRVPDCMDIREELVKENINVFQNDHVAFRSFQSEHLGINTLKNVFEAHGYEKRDEFRFESKHLRANWFSPPRMEFPRVFISELIVDELPKNCQDIIHSYIDEVTEDLFKDVNLLFPDDVFDQMMKLPWRIPSFKDYQQLSHDSEYAAWTLAHGFKLNHSTFSVHNQEAINTLEEFNNFLESRDFILNDSGGKIKVSADGKLLQSSTVAVISEYLFADGHHAIPESFVEFAERKVLDEFADVPPEDIQPHMRRDSFEMANADKIFESTNLDQTAKRNK